MYKITTLYQFYRDDLSVFSNYKHLAYQLLKISPIKVKSKYIIGSCFLKSMTVKISRYEYQYHNLKNLKKIYLLSDGDIIARNT